MGCQHKQIRLFDRRLPALHPVRQIARAEDKNLIELEPRGDA